MLDRKSPRREPGVFSWGTRLAKASARELLAKDEADRSAVGVSSVSENIAERKKVGRFVVARRASARDFSRLRQGRGGQNFGEFFPLRFVLQRKKVAQLERSVRTGGAAQQRFNSRGAGRPSRVGETAADIEPGWRVHDDNEAGEPVLFICTRVRRARQGAGVQISSIYSRFDESAPPPRLALCMPPRCRRSKHVHAPN
jgi:hypothetical protein